MVRNKYLARIFAVIFRKRSKGKQLAETKTLEKSESLRKLLDPPQTGEPLEKASDPPEITEPLQTAEPLRTSELFQIPEILHAILRELRNKWWYENDRTILACIFVNHLWHSVSRPLVWECCGGTYKIKNYPVVRYLIAIDKNQRQKYANQIQILRIDNQKHNAKWQWEGQFHTELTNLSFPRLEELSITSPALGSSKSFKPITVPITYLQPRLKTLVIWNHRESECVVEYDKLLSALACQSKNLKEFRLYSDHCPIGASTSTISNVFQDITTLTRLTLRTKSMANMSSEAFLNLSRLPSLLDLEIDAIQSEWVERLEPGAFTALKNLNCGINSYGLEQLLKSIPEVRSLSIRAMKTSTDILDVIARARLSQLGSLEIEPFSSIKFSVHDLFLVAENATGLWWLKIPTNYSEDMEFKTVIDDLDNAQLQALAKRLPQLVTLQLLPRSSKMTETSLISLGLACPKLYHCTLAAATNYQKLIQEASAESFANLKRLEIIEPDEDSRTKIKSKDLQSVAKGLVELMPSLRDPVFPSHSDLSKAICRLVGQD